MDRQEECQFKLRRTPNVAERSAVLYVPQHLVKDDDDTTPGQTLVNFLPRITQKGDARIRGFSSYLLTDSIEAPEGYLGFTFARPAQDTPGNRVPFKSWTVREPYPWPAWLVSLYGWVSTKYTQQIITATGTEYKPRFYDRPEVIPAGQYESEILIEEFTSPTAFTAEELQSENPIATTVFYNYMGVQNAIDCLHDDVFVPEDDEDMGYVHGTFGMRGSRPHIMGGKPGRLFPATGMTGWEEHVFYCRPQFIDGIYYLMRKTVRVPDNIPDPVPHG